MRYSARVQFISISSAFLVFASAGPAVCQDTSIQKAAETAKAFETKVLGRTARKSLELPVGIFDLETAKDTLREQIAEQIESHRKSEFRAATRARDDLRGLLEQAESSVDKATAALDRWEAKVRPCLLDESGSRIAGDERLTTSFQVVFDELDPQVNLARADLGEAQALFGDIRRLLKQDDARKSRFQPSSGLSHRVDSFRVTADQWEKAYSAGSTKIELWAVAAINKKPSAVTLKQVFLDRKEDLRAVEDVGTDLLRVREMAFFLAAMKFANTLTAEAIMRSNIAQVKQLGVMTGLVAYKRSTEEKTVTLQVTKHDANSFEGRLLFDNEDTLWEMQGNLTNQKELYLTAKAPQKSEMAFKGTLQDQRVSGRWFYPGQIGYRGTFLFHLAN